MPVKGSPLTPEQVERVRRWIDEGAIWADEATVAGAKIKQHWSYARDSQPGRQL